jgi:hypothetical protein
MLGIMVWPNNGAKYPDLTFLLTAGRYWQAPNPGVAGPAPGAAADRGPGGAGRGLGQMRPSDFTASRSEASSATVASIFSRENSLMSTPWMISQAPSFDRAGNELIRPSGTP